MQKKHFTFIDKKNSKLKIEFIGKKGVLNSCNIFSDNTSTKCLLNLYKNILENKTDDDFVFKYENKIISFLDVNNFLKEYGGITSKSFRTWNANTFFLFNILKELDTQTEKERKKKTKEAIDLVAEKLHHTPAICKKNYLLMPMINMYVTDLKKFKKIISTEDDHIDNFIRFLKWYCNK